MMTPFELLYLISEPFFPALYGQVRIRLRSLVKQADCELNILDVGGRKSHYTIGFPLKLTISDLPRESEVQKSLHLGINESIRNQLSSRRSNVKGIIYDDMVHSRLPSDSFDGVLAVEVLEHVEDDTGFLHQVHKVLRPGGFFLMTTPNGDHIPNANPDHKRHYRKMELDELIRQVFGEVDEVSYIVADTKQHHLGLRSWSLRRPLATIIAMGSNVLNRYQSQRKGLSRSSDLTCHLVALARKPVKAI